MSEELRVATAAVVIVKAKHDGTAFVSKEEVTSFAFKAGDTGLLQWEWHPNFSETGYLTPLVIWDHDQTGTPRGLLYDNVEPIGIQTREGQRFILSLDPRARSK